MIDDNISSNKSYPDNLFEELKISIPEPPPDLTQTLAYIIADLNRSHLDSVVYLRYKCQMTLVAIAKHEHIRVDYVRAILYRLRDALQHRYFSMLSSGARQYFTATLRELSTSAYSRGYADGVAHLQFLNKAEKLSKEVMAILNPPLSATDLPAWVTNPLRRAGFSTVSDVCNTTIATLRDIRQFGPRSLERLEVYLQKYDLSFRTEGMK